MAAASGQTAIRYKTVWERGVVTRVPIIEGGSPRAEQATVQAVKPQIEFGQVDTTWQHYGLTEAPIKFTGTDGKKHSTGRKGIFRSDELAADVSEKYTLLPNEEVLSLIEAAGYKPTAINYSHGGNAMHAEILTEKQAAVKVGDVVRLGVVIRNSIDSSMGFGGDMFSMRLACANGAIARGAELGSFSHKHIGERSEIVRGLRAAIERLLLATDDLVATYRLSTQIRLNQEFANIVAKTIPEKYLPDYIEVPEDANLPPKITQTPYLWNAFNDSTQKIWHSSRPSMVTKMEYERVLHSALEVAVRVVA